MERKGLCLTCVHFETCIFSKELPVWQCEEFSCGESVPRFRRTKTKRVVSCEVATESE
jgi:hypothetical protein